MVSGATSPERRPRDPEGYRLLGSVGVQGLLMMMRLGYGGNLAAEAGTGREDGVSARVGG